MFSRRLDWLADMLLMFIYTPFLIFVPLLLILGVVFVVVPGGFIIVLGGAYLMFAQLIGLLGIAARRRPRKSKARLRLEPNAQLSRARASALSQRV